MKLGELKSAIRAQKGNPSVATMTPDGRSYMVTTQKTALLQELDRLYDHKGIETGYMLTDANELLPATGAVEAELPDIDLGEIDIDLDDL